MDRDWRRLAVACSGGVGLAIAMGACAGPTQQQGEDVEVMVAGESSHCPASGTAPWLLAFDSLEAVRDWQGRQGLMLVDAGAAAGRYAVVGAGQRSTGGHAVVVDTKARRLGHTLRLTADFIAPASGAMRVQMLTSPCTAVRVPAGPWTVIEIHDQTGALRATSGVQ